jgi:DNA-binding MarR family transcriptional regulator
MTGKDNEIVVRLAECIRRFQQVNRFAVRNYGRKVSENLQGHIMLQVEAQTTTSVDQMVRALNVPQATLSRAIKFLLAEKLLVQRSNPRDRRVREISLTAGGRRYLDSWHARYNHMTDDLASRLTGPELLRLVSYQKRFSDGLGAEDHPFSVKVGPMRRQVIRITRGLELLRTDLFRPFGLSSLEWHLLAEIGASDSQCVARELCVTFGAPTNTVATAIKSLERSGFLTRIPDDDDARRRFLQVTRKGRGILRRVLNRQLQVLASATAEFSPEELREFVELSEKLFQIGEFQKSSTDAFVIRRLESSQEIATGRRFVLQQLFDTAEDRDLPGEILARKNIAFGLFHEGELSGVCEVDSDGDIVNLFISNVIVEEFSPEQFYSHCTSEARTQA